MNLTPQENYLEAVRYGAPEYMPRGNEEIYYNIDEPFPKKQTVKSLKKQTK